MDDRMNKYPTRRDVLALPFAAALALHAGGAMAQGGYPDKPIKILVGFAPGGFTDVAARLIGQKLTESLGQPVVVENRPGANGSPGHLSGALLQVMTKIRMDHVPYRGSGPAMNDLLGGHVDISFPTIPTALLQVRAGKLKAIAVTGAKRSPMMPEVPTIAEA